MSDEKLRELERRWKETQSVEDEAAYLLERVRTGDLEKEKLELAAYCGHEAARPAHQPHGRVPVVLPPKDSQWDEWEDWVRQLPNHSEECLTRMLVALSRGAIRDLALVPSAQTRTAESRPALPTAICSLEAVEESILSDSVEHKEAALDPWPRKAAERLQSVGDHYRIARAPAEPLEVVLAAALAIQPWWSLRYSLTHALFVRSRTGRPALEELRAEVIPWLLDRGDPVRVRVEERRHGGSGG